jgi:hypothetical protein
MAGIEYSSTDVAFAGLAPYARLFGKQLWLKRARSSLSNSPK